MSLLLQHLPHIALAVGIAALVVRMEVAERRQSAHGPTLGGAVGTLVALALAGSATGLSVVAARGDRPAASLVVDYLVTGTLAAAWAAWRVPRSLPEGARERLGAGGRAAVRGAVALVVLGGCVWSALLLSHGVLLPAAA